MHEMSIALSILEIVKEETEKANSTQVNEIVLDIGKLSGVEIESLEFSMSSCFTEQMFESCEFKINTIDAVSLCQDCNKEFESENLYSLCPHCGSFLTSIVKGQEMNIKSILVE